MVHEQDQPEIIAALENPEYRARIERAFLITVEAFEWNCPQHIVPRYTKEQVQKMIEPLVTENENLKAQLQLLLSQQREN